MEKICYIKKLSKLSDLKIGGCIKKKVFVNSLKEIIVEHDCWVIKEITFSFLDNDKDIPKIDKYIMHLFTRKILNSNGNPEINDLTHYIKDLLIQYNPNFFETEELWGKILSDNFGIKFKEVKENGKIRISFIKGCKF
jgi:hypothetical protein